MALVDRLAEISTRASQAASCAQIIVRAILQGLAAVALSTVPAKAAEKSQSGVAVADDIYSATEAGDWQLSFTLTKLEALLPDALNRKAALEFIAKLANEPERDWPTLSEGGLRFPLPGWSRPETGSCDFVDGARTKSQFSLTAECKWPDVHSVKYRLVGTATPSALDAKLDIALESASGRSIVRATADIWQVRTYDCNDPRSGPCTTTSSGPTPQTSFPPARQGNDPQ